MKSSLLELFIPEMRTAAKFRFDTGPSAGAFKGVETASTRAVETTSAGVAEEDRSTSAGAVDEVDMVAVGSVASTSAVETTATGVVEGDEMTPTRADESVNTPATGAVKRVDTTVAGAVDGVETTAARSVEGVNTSASWAVEMTAEGSAGQVPSSSESSSSVGAGTTPLVLVVAMEPLAGGTIEQRGLTESGWHSSPVSTKPPHS